MKYKTQIKGQCHCWNLKYTLSSNNKLSDFQWRICQCSFCTSHWANWASDPLWKLDIKIQDKDLVNKYQNRNSISDSISELTADFYVCKGCWVLTLSVSNINWNEYAVFNLNSSEHAKRFADNFINTDFEWESLEERLERREKNWIWDVLINK